MTAAKPLARYSAIERALRSRPCSLDLHHDTGHDPYVMWRLNWIHAFTDGNGRTSRAVSWLVLCMRLGYQLPGVRTIPDQITENRDPYYRALEDADDAAKEGRIDLSSLESLMGDMLAVQLVAVHKDANGTAQ